MSGLFGALGQTTASMKAVERSIAAVQNNVANVSTPGFAKMRHQPQADRFEPSDGVFGGVRPGDVISYRNQFAEASVRERTSQWAKQQQAAGQMQRLEPVMSVSTDKGISGAIDRMFQSFSQLTVAPNDMSARQIALDRAAEVGDSFRQAAGTLEGVRSQVDGELRTSVKRVNELASTIVELNVAKRKNPPASQGGAPDSGLDAAMNNALEELSTYANFQSLEQGDGSVAIFLGGSRLLAIGDKTYPISLGNNGDSRAILDSEGADITSVVTGGGIGGQLEGHNQTIPSLQNDLNALAESVAGEVNFALQGGADLDNATPGAELFSFDVTSGAARSLRTTGITPRQLALADPAQPGGNGNALNLVEVGRRKQTNGYTFGESLGIVAGKLGRQLQDARGNIELGTQLLTQAKAQRQADQGVSLDEEAALLVQLQRSYQAAAQLFRTLNEMTQDVINMAR